MKFLIIQTAFIGDVVLATPVAEKLYKFFPESSIDLLVKKGNEKLFEGHPFIGEILTLDKTKHKISNLLSLLVRIRNENYSHVINIHRFGSTGFLTAFSGAKYRIGFDKNPFSTLFNKVITHEFGDQSNFIHEIDRNLKLIEEFTDSSRVLPKLYPRIEDIKKVRPSGKYTCIAPAAVWTTKQYPAKNWLKLIQKLPIDHSIYLIGGPADHELCEKILIESGRDQIINLAGKMSFLESCALMQNANMNYVNDSAPTHFASAVNAPVTTIFCSTIPEFGFTPLSENSKIVQTSQNLECRPCGIHGKKACPLGHFNCAEVDI